MLYVVQQVSFFYNRLFIITNCFYGVHSSVVRCYVLYNNCFLLQQIIHDYKLFCMVFTLVLLDAIILTTWQIIDPLYKDTRNLSSYVSNTLICIG